MRRPFFSKRRLLCLSLFLGLYLAFCAYAAKFLVDMTLRQPHSGAMALAPPPWLMQASSDQKADREPQEVSGEPQDGITLPTCYSPHTPPTTNTVILLHMPHHP